MSQALTPEQLPLVSMRHISSCPNETNCKSKDLFGRTLKYQTMAKKKSVTIPTSHWEFHCLPPNTPGTFQMTSTCHSLHLWGLWRAPQEVQEIQVHIQTSAMKYHFAARMGSHRKHNSPQGYAPEQKVGSLQEQTCWESLQFMDGDLLSANELN